MKTCFLSLLLLSHFAIGQTTLFNYNASWKYLDNGSNQGTAWTAAGFDDSSWASGNGQLGYGDGDESTVVSYGPSSTNKYLTTYFRKSVAIANINDFAQIQLNCKRDDGIVVYVNGSEVWRNNMPSGTILYNTTASGDASDDGNGIQTSTLDAATAGFVTGTNVIAVEVHQRNNTSSDLSFDMEMIGLEAPSQTQVVGLGASWKYKDDGSNQGTSWITAGFNDASWSTGNAEFGYGDSDEATLINACGTVTQNPSCTNKYPTSYFRKSVSISNINLYQSFLFKVRRDDGAVVYVNGTEIWRNNMPAGTIAYNTFASAACSDDGADLNAFTLSVPASFFVSGMNTIAVEIHQNSGSSSDLSFDMEILALAPVPGGASLERGPYIQSLTENSVILHWKTDVTVDTKVQYGTNSAALTQEAALPTPTTDHIVTLSGLTPNTKYFYAIGTSVGVIQGDTNNYFTTAPLNGSEGKYTFWVSGDCGTNTTHQRNVRDRYLEYMDGKSANGWLLLGDNAYNSGTEQEYSSNFFDIYESNLMRNTPLWPAPGNHDYANSGSRQNDHAVPYFDIFDLPSNGEAGGVPSGTEAFYSYDYGNIHFLALDSYGKEDNATRLYDTLGAQVQWIKADLAANNKPWVVAYWHHAPYTKGSHNSDTEGELISIRQNFIRILEREGVDLILCGHSHDYERSKLMHGHYGNESSFNPAVHNLSQSSGKYDGSANSCTYVKDSTNHTLEGTVYVLSGASGKLGGTQAGYPHDALPFANSTDGGSLLLEFESNRLDVKWLCADGVIRDNFTIIKNANKRDTLTLNYGDSATLSASWVGEYSWSSNGSANRSNVVSPEQSGFEVVTDQYQCVSDSVYINVILPTTTLNTPSTMSYCVDEELQLDFSLNGYFRPSNLFILELSDANGAFGTPVQLDTISGNQAGSFLVILPDNLPNGSYSLRIVSSYPQVVGPVLSGLQIHEIPLVSISGLNASYIENEPNVPLTGTPFGGTFSGPGVNALVFSPVAAGVGAHEIVYTYSDVNACSSADTTLVTVLPIPPGVQIPALTTSAYCVGDEIQVTYLTQGTFDPANEFELQLSDAAGSFSNPLILGTQTGTTSGIFQSIVPMSLPSGTGYLLRIAASNPSLMTPLADPLQIFALPVVSFTGLNANYIENDPATSLLGTPSGGTFSGTGISGSVFDPFAAGVGGPYEIIYEFTDSNGCSSSDTMHTSVSADQTSSLVESVNGVDLKVYPNPAKEKMLIHLESNRDFSLEMEVLSLLGIVESVVHPTQLSQGIHEFELNARELNLSKGVYYLRLQVNGVEKQWKICFN